jgi:hypothetical protein
VIRPSRSVVALLALVAASAAPAVAQESDWQIDFGAAVQFTTLGGDISFTGVDDARTLSLGDLLSSGSPGLAIDFDVWYGDWGLVTDVFALEYEGKAATDQNAVFTTQVGESVGRITVARRLSPNAFVYAGTRFWSAALAFRLTEPNPGTLDGSDNWIDPIIGGSIDKAVGEDGWFAGLDADIGGFGVSSDFTWHAMGSFGYEVSPGWSVLLSYQATGVTYSTESSRGGGTVDYDTIRHGAHFGLLFHF